MSKEGGFQLIFRDRYLLSIAALVVLLNIVNTSGEFLLSKLVVAEAARAFPGAAMTAARARFIGEFYGSFFGWVNLAGLVLQSFFVSRILQSDRSRRRAVRWTRYCLDRLLRDPGRAGFGTGPRFEDSRQQQRLFDSEYRAPSAVPSDEPGSEVQGQSCHRRFFWRFGDVLQAGVVYIGTALGFVLSSFAALNLAFTVVWIFIATALAREYQKRSSQSGKASIEREGTVTLSA